MGIKFREDLFSQFFYNFEKREIKEPRKVGENLGTSYMIAVRTENETKLNYVERQ